MNRAEVFPHRVLSVRTVNTSVFVIRIKRNGLNFKTGQHINVGPYNAGYTREYSVYSGENDSDIEILVKEVKPPEGFVSPMLREVKAGDQVMVEWPLGYFALPSEPSKLLLVATGTGIASYHSFISTYPDLDYLLLHGIEQRSDACEPEFYDPEKLILCTSKKEDGDYFGRVTSWLKENDLSKFEHVYLCGNRNMINDAREILTQKGFASDQIRAEAYF